MKMSFYQTPVQYFTWQVIVFRLCVKGHNLILVTFPARGVTGWYLNNLFIVYIVKSSS